MKGSKGPGRHRCEATLLQMNDAKVDLEYKEVVRKGDKQEGVFWSLHSDLMIQIKDQFRLSTVNNKLCKKCVKKLQSASKQIQLQGRSLEFMLIPPKKA